jgi:hypothetical protein
VPVVEELVEEARRLDLSSTVGWLRLGDVAEAICRFLPPVGDLLGRLAVDLEIDRRHVVDAWYVSTAFPPTTRRAGLSWVVYDTLRFHPDRHHIADLAARGGWSVERIREELSARLVTRYPTGAAGW